MIVFQSLPNTGASNRPRPATEPVVTLTPASGKEETEEVFGQEGSDGASGVGEAGKGPNQATRQESEGACGGSPDDRTNSETITRQNNSGDGGPPL